jgi:hypothetical protein
MGQYYIAIILAEDGHRIRLCMCASSYRSGVKLMEHSYINCNFIKAFEYLISPDGGYHKSRIVWAGDYADNEIDSNGKPDCSGNLYHIALNYVADSKPPVRDTTKYRYIVNHTKRVYIDKQTLGDINNDNFIIHPLPLLVSEGNGRGGGDYSGLNEELCGTWARDIISVESELPLEYTLFGHKFTED